MKFLYFPLIVLIFVMFIVQAHGMQTLGTTNSFTIDSDTFTGTQTQNQDTTSFSMSTTYGTFSPDLTNGIIAIIIALIAVGAVAGIRVLGSGISETSVRIIYNSVFFYALWGILSVFALNGANNDGLNSLPFSIGYILWFLMTLFYSLGIVQQINGTGSNQGGN
jgi:hypothetical protein